MTHGTAHTPSSDEARQSRPKVDDPFQKSEMLDRLTPMGEFRSPEDESAFQMARWPRTKQYLKLQCAVGLVFVLGWIPFDYQEMSQGPLMHWMLAARAVASLAIAWTFWEACARYRPRATFSWSLFATQLTLYAPSFLLYVCRIEKLGPAAANATFLILLTLCFYTMSPTRVHHIVLASLLATATLQTLDLMMVSPFHSRSSWWTLGTMLLVNLCGLWFARTMNMRARVDYLQQRALTEARTRAEEASRAKSQFLAMMSHEIRTPLHGIVMATESAKRFAELPEALQQTHETIDRCAEHLRVLIDDLLDLASIDSGKMSLTPSDTDIHTLLSETTQVVGDLARKRGLTFCLEQRGNLPRYLWADPVRLKQILFNLCGNAIKFTKRGSVTVALDASRVDEAHVRLHFAISDTGIGMTKAEVERALEPFYQADNSMQRKHEGVGLGLAISARFIEAMGGSLELESEKGHGTTCRFALQMQLGLAPKSNSAVATVKGLRVIVADDAELNRRLLGTLLAGMGHEAIMAENGVEAVAAAAAGEVDLILMDLHMPEMDGISAARAIRTLPDPAAASLPIIALSADVAHERVAECHAAGLDMVLPKPLRQHHLERALQSLFGDGAESLPWVDPRRLREVASTMSHADYAQTLQDFRKTTASLLAALESADDRDRLHLLKGLAANFGLPRLQNSLQRFREGDLTLEALHRVAAESLERLGQNGLS